VGYGRRRRSSPADWSPPDTDGVRTIYRRLSRRYGPLDPPHSDDPLEELIVTVLSQNTSDVNRDRAYAALRARFPTWEDVLAAPLPALVEAIRPGGLAPTKAPRIKAILAKIREREGRLDLSWLRGAPTERVREYLASLPGVGPKTVACVLAFSLGRPALPVDTHVHRTALRLGLIPPGLGAGRAHEAIEAVVPPRIRVRMHVGLIRLGRNVCRAGIPRCAECALVDRCPAAPLFLTSTLQS